MLIFVSYARRDHPAVRSLAERLRLLHHEVWLDDELTGGQVWWDRILASIRDCDVLLFAVSPGALESEACSLERQYAAALGKPVLPVMVETVPSDLLPPDLAVVQVVDYATPGEEAAFRMFAALSVLPPAAPLPEPLPEPPRVPISYLSDISRRVHGPSLTLDEQLALVARLKLALQRSEDRQATLGLLAKLRQRDDLYYVAARELDQLDAEPKPAPAGEPATPGGASNPPPARPAPIVPVEDAKTNRAGVVGRGGAGTGQRDQAQAVEDAPDDKQRSTRDEQLARQKNLIELRKAAGRFENGMYDGQKKALERMVTGKEQLLALCRCGFPEDAFRYVALLITSDQLMWCRQVFAAVRKGSVRWDEVTNVRAAKDGFSVTTRDRSTLEFISLTKTGIWIGSERRRFGPEPVKQLVQELVTRSSGQRKQGTPTP
jgi:TIR domain